MFRTAKGIRKHLRRTAVSEGVKRTVEPLETSQESGTRADENGGIEVSAATKTFAGERDESSEAASHNGANSTSARAQSMTA